ncbi:Wzz/FepE/Etk N-terminal domain-containing protein [Pseudoalteromonas sp. DL2-H2.2]|uniref:Wzz/FepE/Etk N-terminal domain-containing protein n=1 Tax=Pseudoalteromonas sp. DL2-H2.2 TaxID=2908889 RepID=UPI001F221674|nr:Wzz/FepE/Etk N-terminal domain-containing protein [Pseudoalteromonas sp. DL2-H2.2]MCF2908820.1 Wzz/FepE/Etk N-terminal domain-containing protein [Pseudoalteromonas sp. DL2-H2.2]
MNEKIRNTEANLSNDSLDFELLFQLFMSNKWKLIGISFLFSVLAVVYSLSLPNIFKSEATLITVSNKSGDGLSSLSGGLSGIAAIAGVNLSGGDSSEAKLALATLKSRQFITDIIDEYSLKKYLFAVERYDYNSGKLYFNKDIYSEEKDTWAEIDGESAEPSGQKAYQEFINQFSVFEDTKKGVVRIAFLHQSPMIAKFIVDKVIYEINTKMKKKAIELAEGNRFYLEGQIENTSVLSLKEKLYELIEKQIETVMLANVRKEYIFETLDPAIVPELKAAPNRVVICLVGGILGFLFSIAYVLLFCRVK